VLVVLRLATLEKGWWAEQRFEPLCGLARTRFSGLEDVAPRTNLRTSEPMQAAAGKVYLRGIRRD